MKWFLLGVLLTHGIHHLNDFLDEMEDFAQANRELSAKVLGLFAPPTAPLDSNR